MELHEYSFELGVNIEIFQSNFEGEIIDKIQYALGNFDGIILNAGAYTHTSVAIRDALTSVKIPTVEVHISKMLGFSGDRILFTGNNITNDELKFVHDEGAVLNIDSVSALNRLAKMVDPEGLKISFRVNPMVGAGHHDHCITGGVMSKFGIMDNEAVEVYEMAKELGFNPIGMHAHIGSGILDPEPFKH